MDASSDFVLWQSSWAWKKVPSAALDHQFANLAPDAPQYVQVMAMPAIFILAVTKLSKAAIEQFFALHSQQRRTGEIHLGDHAFAGEREVTDGSEFIKINIAVARLFQGNCARRNSSFCISSSVWSKRRSCWC
jgi:hypothetical protein